MFNCVYLGPCAPVAVTKYQKRVSSPMQDGIDIHIEVSRVDYERLSGDCLGKSSESFRKPVQEPIEPVSEGYHRVLKLARTIADLAGSDQIQSVPLAEALQYRSRLMKG